MKRTTATSNVACAAFLRGIGPGDPRKSNESLRRVFEQLGFDNVRSFISSGNILFESPQTATDQLEQMIEKGFRDQLGMEVPAFVRSRKEIEAFVARKPFGALEHKRETYLTVTLLRTGNRKQGRAVTGKRGDDVRVVSYDVAFRAVCAVTDTTAAKTPDFMIWLERELGKDITTRTQNTLERVLRKL
jgi:uncharacterized protein (DUF1697 family)